MLFTLLSLLGGFVTRLLPEALNLYREKKEREHELAMMKLSRDMAKDKSEAAFRRADMEAALEDAAGARDYALDAARVMIEGQKMLAPQRKTGFRWLDAFNSSIRSIITIWVIVLWTLAKVKSYAMFVAFQMNGAPMYLPIEIAEHLWNTADQALMSAIIGYHFGVQAVNAYRRG